MCFPRRKRICARGELKTGHLGGRATARVLCGGAFGCINVIKRGVRHMRGTGHHLERIDNAPRIVAMEGERRARVDRRAPGVHLGVPHQLLPPRPRRARRRGRPQVAGAGLESSAIGRAASCERKHNRHASRREKGISMNMLTGSKRQLLSPTYSAALTPCSGSGSRDFWAFRLFTALGELKGVLTQFVAD